jgi:hypothetical protein
VRRCLRNKPPITSKGATRVTGRSDMPWPGATEMHHCMGMCCACAGPPFPRCGAAVSACHSVAAGFPFPTRSQKPEAEKSEPAKSSYLSPPRRAPVPRAPNAGCPRGLASTPPPFLCGAYFAGLPQLLRSEGPFWCNKAVLGSH